MIGWNFPSNNFGQEIGLNDAGIETFRGNPLESLAREINQNSCDAAWLDSNQPVEVHFELYKLSMEQFPNKDEFLKILIACKKYWEKNFKTKKFFDNAIDHIKETSIPILKISDYNTVGLRGSCEGPGTDWHRLIKSVGASNKDGQSGGAFGIGKHAPFACSQIRTVFYGTKDIEGNTAFQGVAKLVTYMNDKDETTQGTGYFGITERNTPLRDVSDMPEIFQRTKIGTDVFIAGFNAVNNWKEQIIKSVLENFFIAIYQERLIVKVEEIIINSSTLFDMLEMYAKDDEYLADMYYKALTSERSYHFVEEDFEGLGRLKLFVLSERDYPKRVAMVRGTGMKIFDKGHFRVPLKFVGVMLAEGKELNEFLRSLEPPSHNAWEYHRYEEDKSYAQKIIKKLYAWINEQIHSVSRTDEEEELDAEGISQYLPDDLDEHGLISQTEGGEGDKVTPKNVELKKIIRSYTNPGQQIAATSEQISSKNSFGRGKKDGKGQQRSVTEGSGFGDSGQERNQSDCCGESKTRNEKPVKIKKVRSFCINPDFGEYLISFEPHSDGEIYLDVQIVGEVGKEAAPIKRVFENDTKRKISVMKKGKIGPLKCTKGVKSSIKVTLEDSLRCALEVSQSGN